MNSRNSIHLRIEFRNIVVFLPLLDEGFMIEVLWNVGNMNTHYRYKICITNFKKTFSSLKTFFAMVENPSLPPYKNRIANEASNPSSPPPLSSPTHLNMQNTRRFVPAVNVVRGLKNPSPAKCFWQDAFFSLGKSERMPLNMQQP